jgi:hypothetical protein
MEFTVATINSILFPLFLFLVTFCFLCCQLPRHSHINSTIEPKAQEEAIATPQQEDEPESGEEILSEQEPAVEGSAIPSAQPDTPVTEDLENVPVEADAGESVTAFSVSNPQSSLEAQVLAALDNLGKREARKLMGGLKLQQKRNGVELSTELMIASIRREFKVSPERVIEVINERLPELLTNATAREEQLATLKSKGQPAA